MKSSLIVVGLVGFLFVLTISQSVALADTVTLTFQEGDGGAYSSTHAATLDVDANTGDGAGAVLWAENYYDWDINWVCSSALVRFPDIIGGNPGQIPPGSTIESATLQLKRAYPSDYSVSLFHISSSWDESTVTARPGNAGPVTTLPQGQAGETHVVDVTNSVQSWVSGLNPNWGFEVYAVPGPNLAVMLVHGFHSDDAANLVDRPLLFVEFTAPLTATEATTWGKVKALYR